jgi:hypothetical protein
VKCSRIDSVIALRSSLEMAENAEPWLLNECLVSDIELWQFRRAIGKSVDGET